ncbi:hypothetical protein [Sphingorhabdus sp.]|uniref:hypothetical protein n=1 Tax=Sphingorhabdus sp. TaxID=1902408 RepID=UPI00391C373F
MNINIDWQPTIGDPSLAGWLTVFGYFASAVICYLASRSERARVVPRLPSTHDEAHFWGIVTIVMMVLGFNKQLDLQSLLTQIGRYFAVAGGWYHQRQAIQLLFIICLIACSIIGAVILLRALSKAAMEIRIALVGLCLLGCFIVIRAASFHHIDTAFRTKVLLPQWNVALELGSIFLVAIAGLRYWRHPTSDR